MSDEHSCVLQPWVHTLPWAAQAACCAVLGSVETDGIHRTTVRALMRWLRFVVMMPSAEATKMGFVARSHGEIETITGLAIHLALRPLPLKVTVSLLLALDAISQHHTDQVTRDHARHLHDEMTFMISQIEYE